MISTTRKLEISGSVFFKEPDTLADYQEKTTRLLRSLQALHPIFQSWAIVDDSIPVPLQDDLSDLNGKILSLTERGSRRDLIIKGEMSGISSLTLSRIGFTTRYLSQSPFSAVGDSRNTEGVQISIQGNSAGAEPNGGVILVLPALSEQSAFTANDVRQIIVTLASAWSLSVVSAGTQEFENAIAQDGDLYSGQWMVYYRQPELHHCLSDGLTCTTLSDGVLVELGPYCPDPANPSHVAAAKRLREALDHLGLVWHSTYAIHGWPPDEEEWRYEEFITGAPRDRKYRVRCIDFDGYDAQRDVLLYAKLFRRLRQQRKEWGLRGWDGPVLNEARRQVRAANGTQIEWHVGLEEPAARVRTLLADYTDFKEEQLRVLYTPVSQMAAR